MPLFQIRLVVEEVQKNRFGYTKTKAIKNVRILSTDDLDKASMALRALREMAKTLEKVLDFVSVEDNK
jgi:hypothetical protein